MCVCVCVCDDEMTNTEIWWAVTMQDTNPNNKDGLQYVSTETWLYSTTPLFHLVLCRMALIYCYKH